MVSIALAGSPTCMRIQCLCFYISVEVLFASEWHHTCRRRLLHGFMLHNVTSVLARWALDVVIPQHPLECPLEYPRVPVATPCSTA